MKRLLPILLFVFSLQVGAQNNNPVAPDTTVYIVVDTMPQYPGGPGAMMKYLSTNTENYHSIPCVTSKIHIQFVVDKEGKVQQPKAYVRAVTECNEIDDYLRSLEKILTMMPAWSPGILNGKPVNVRLTLQTFICWK